MKKNVTSLLALLCAMLLFLCPMLQNVTAALPRQMNILDSILPDERGEDRSADAEKAPAATDEQFSIFGAVLVAVLSAVAVVLAFVYVFGKRFHRNK